MASFCTSSMAKLPVTNEQMKGLKDSHKKNLRKWIAKSPENSRRPA